MMKRILIVLSFAWLCLYANAQFTLSGSIKAENGESIAGASVVVQEKNIAVITDNNGMYSISIPSKGTYTLTVSFLGFESHSETLELTGNTFKEMILHESVTKFEEVIVSSVRAQKNTPTTYSYLNKSELSKLNSGQDAPYLIDMQPSVVVTSDAGTGIGYTSMHIRGSDNKKINVTINGVPLNDPESHGVYWVDVPDIASSAQSIQIQRGVGTSTNGSGAFGASINLLTDNISQKPFLSYSGAAGSYNTYKSSFHAASGIFKKHFFFEGKVGQLKSDGYIDRGWSKLNNYFSQSGYTSEKTLVKLVSFGGFEETYQSWYGIDKDMLNTNRKYNYAGYIGYDTIKNKDVFYDQMKDHYQQDHLQLHVAHKFNDTWSFNTAAHYTYGRGYYQDYVPSASLLEYKIPLAINGTDTIASSDIVHQLWLKNHFYGAIWGFNFIKEKYSITLGGGINTYHPAHHYGQVIFAKDTAIKINGSKYYENEGKKTDWNTYLKLNYNVLPDVTAFADVQFRGLHYKASGISREYENVNININEKYVFFNPKVGAFYSFTPKTNIYVSYAIANREPNRNDFLKAPLGTKPKSESLNDIELGIRHTENLFSAELVFYNMQYKNQLVLTGQFDNEGTPIRKNVAKSYRSGVELLLAFKPNEFLKFEQNLALSTNKIEKYPVQDSIGAAVTYKTVNIAYSPSLIMSQRVTLFPMKHLEIACTGKYVSKQYLDNDQNDARSLEAYYVIDCIVNYLYEVNDRYSVAFFVKTNNLTNQLYVSNGYMYGSTPLYFPQAERNFMAGITVKF